MNQYQVCECEPYVNLYCTLTPGADGLSVRGASADGHSARARAESATAVCARRHVPTGRELQLERERRAQSVRVYVRLLTTLTTVAMANTS